MVLACYLLGAVALTARYWIDPAGRVAPADPTPADSDLFAWSMWYAAHALAHGHLPALVTTTMNAPLGVNLMWNTTILLPATLLAPVTLVAGPQVSLTVLLTLSYAGSAASLFWVLRRWNAGLLAAALGGAVYGFSPALVDSAIGHYDLVIAITPPLIVDALLRILTRRGSPLLAGSWLGVLVVAQIFTEEELLVDTALACVVLIAVIAARRAAWDQMATTLRSAVKGLAAAGVVALVLGGYGLWVQFHGPLAEHGSPWPAASFTTTPVDLVRAPGTMLLHTAADAAVAGRYPPGLWEYLGYLGYPLLVVLAIAAVAFWRDLRIRACVVTFAVLEVISLDDSWLRHLPLLGEMLPDRLAIVADGAAAAALAFALERGWSLARSRSWPVAVPAVIAVFAVLPLVPLPLKVAPATSVPVGWTQAFSALHLTTDARVLVVPVPDAHLPQALAWQTATGEPAELIGGWFIGPDESGEAKSKFFGTPQATAAILCLDRVWGAGSASGCPSKQAFAADFRYWNPAAVVAVTSAGSPLARFLTSLLGQPVLRSGSVLAWR